MRILFSFFLLLTLSEVVLAESRTRPVLRRPSNEAFSELSSGQSTPQTFTATPPSHYTGPRELDFDRSATGISGNLNGPAPTPDETIWWQPKNYRHFVGYESATSTLGILGKNAIAAGFWDHSGFGMEFFLGYTKTADTFSRTVTAATNQLTAAGTEATTAANVKYPHTFIIGVNPKWRIFQNQWFQLSAGPVVSISPPTSVIYETGTSTKTIPNTGIPETYSVVETAWGTVDSSTAMQINLGLKVGTEFYVKWFPHLALGFGTGIVTSWGGGTTKVTSTKTRNYNVTAGVEQTPSSSSATTSTIEIPGAISGTTFGIGGTSFSFTGIFTIRYVW